MEIICPRCNRKAKLKEATYSNNGRKKVILTFPCHHYAELDYNVPVSVDDNTIIKDFNTIKKEYFDKTYYLSHRGERRLQ